MSNLGFDNNNLLSHFPSYLRKNIEQLCFSNKIGLSDIALSDITLIPNKFINEENEDDCFHFIIRIPYAGRHLKWELFFDPDDLDFPPDFDFNDNHFLENPDEDIIRDNIPSLLLWNLKSSRSLSQVLQEFLILYKNLQVEKLKQENIYSHYYEEYEALITGDNSVQEEDVEIQVEANSISFLILIRTDCSELPKYIQPITTEQDLWYNPGDDFVHLRISIMKLDGSRTSESLFLSPKLHQLIGDPKELHIPKYNRDVPLSEYVASITVMIDNRISFIVEHCKMKKLYITTLVAMCSNSIVEYDTECFSMAVLLHTVKDYTCLISISFGPKFPQAKPIVSLLSVYCQDGRNCKDNFDGYSYNMDDSPEENITMLLKSLDGAILIFKNHKH